MCYSSHFKDTLTLENQPFFKRMEILTNCPSNKMRKLGDLLVVLEKKEIKEKKMQESSVVFTLS